MGLFSALFSSGKREREEAARLGMTVQEVTRDLPEFSGDGTVTLESPAIDPTGELLLPKVAFFDAGSVLAGRCGPRLAGRASSLVVEPRRMADVAPDALRSMLEILAPETSTTCQPAAAARS